MAKKNELTIRSSAAEYLTFVAATGDDAQSVEMRYEDSNIWLTQKMMSVLYDVRVQNIGQHIKKIFADNELDRESTIKKYFIVQTEGGRKVSREIEHYNLQMIIAVGFKVKNERSVQFRKWASSIVKDYTIQGWVMDTERLKSGGSVLTRDYFECQLEKIREIRMSERKFYQKITDLYATALDYDKTAAATRRFFATVQNKMHYAIHGQTAAGVIVGRATAEPPRMGLTTWEGAPSGKIHKTDVVVAKNYLTELELGQMARMVSAYLDFGENMALRNIPITMADWEIRLNRFIEMFEYGLLKDAGRISAEIAKLHALTEFEKYRITQDCLFESDFDRFVALEQGVEQIRRILPTESGDEGGHE
ncbi:MAG: hypothetical protein DDT37_01832 [Firmicutes bacterium]|nr:hypothetical protein [candidate division NPL-UPA2 bacterium]